MLMVSFDSRFLHAVCWNFSSVSSLYIYGQNGQCPAGAGCFRQGHHHNGDWAAWRPRILCSICVHSFGALVKALQLFITSLHNQPMYPMYPKMCSIDISVNLTVISCNLKGGLFDTRSGVTWTVGAQGWAHSIDHPWVPISFPLTDIFYLLPFSSYLAGSKSISVPPGYDDKYCSRSHCFIVLQKWNTRSKWYEYDEVLTSSNDVW